jgi:hypothetical protein
MLQKDKRSVFCFSDTHNREYVVQREVYLRKHCESLRASKQVELVICLHLLCRIFCYDSSVKDAVVRGMNLWAKKNVTISGERIYKVDRVAAQVKPANEFVNTSCMPASFSLMLCFSR